MTTETQTTKKGTKPTEEIFPVGADGKPQYAGRVAAWKHSKGGGYNFTIKGQRYVMFPVRHKPKSETATEGESA